MVETQHGPEWPRAASGYELKAPVGQGAFGLVWKAEVKEGKNKSKHVAIKVINLEQFSENSMDDIRKEISVMNLC